jgi:hypothetical protein
VTFLRPGDFGPRRGKITRRTPWSNRCLFNTSECESAITSGQARRVTEDGLITIQRSGPQLTAAGRVVCCTSSAVMI